MKIGVLASFSIIAGALSFAMITSTPRTVEAADACQTKEFKTKMVKEACAKGQKAAKDAMKAWMKEKKLKSCNVCHSKLAPTYELKKDGVQQFVKLGGELLPSTKKTK
ncbi:MAG: hypothetical protein ACKV2T_28295 [Kofleriaceae bacterium]